VKLRGAGRREAPDGALRRQRALIEGCPCAETKAPDTTAGSSIMLTHAQGPRRRSGMSVGSLVQCRVIRIRRNASRSNRSAVASRSSALASNSASTGLISRSRKPRFRRPE
jgi:hypothetical protein